jgi:hypothetical protein
MQCYHQKAPRANGGAAAAHLVNFALQRVTQRLKNHKDPRMASLNSVNKLLSLQTGDKLQYKWGSRQPVRRRRGDVHEDITVAVFKLDWEGAPHPSLSHALIHTTATDTRYNTQGTRWCKAATTVLSAGAKL